jgi:hypothetical protein
MARLYVVNATGQNLIVNYRLDFTIDDLGRRTSEKLVPYKFLQIPARQQVPFGGDWHPIQIAEIVQQLEKAYGAAHVSNVKTAKLRGRVKIVWSQDQKVSHAICNDVYHHNLGFLTDQGEERRRNLAVLADMQLTDLIDKTPPKMELEFEGVEDDEDGPARLTEGIIVKHRAAPPPPAKRTRARRAA